MGFLKGADRKIIPYKSSKKYQKIIINNSVLQIAKLLSLFAKQTKNSAESLKYGTEQEGFLLKRVKKDGKEIICVDPRNAQFIKEGNERFHKDIELILEFSKFMIEVIPSKPFYQFLNLNEPYQHFKQTSTLLCSLQDKGSIVLLAMSTLPRLGTKDCHITEDGQERIGKELALYNKVTDSQLFYDELITDHSRFQGFIGCIPDRCGKTQNTSLPVYPDTHSQPLIKGLDHIGFAFSNTALQITFSSKDMETSRWVYDQMHVFSCFSQAFTNCTLGIMGKMTKEESRFNILRQILDDRKPSELSSLKKSRYDTINLYISNDKRNRLRYNDRPFTINKKFKKKLKRHLKKQGSPFYKDTRLLNHFAYLFIKEAITVLDGMVIKDNLDNSCDFEMIQSTNWNDVRFKPPCGFDSKLGWLMEFRAMDNPITDREKAAVVFFFTLIQRMVVDEKLRVNFYIPISVCDDNFDQAIIQDAIIKGKFQFRRYFCEYLHGNKTRSDEMVKLSVEEFLVGNNEFDGMKSLIEAFIKLNRDMLAEESKKCGKDIEKQIWSVFDFYVARARGELLSNSSLLRKFVLKHKAYKQDSTITSEIQTDLINFLLDIRKKDYHEDLFGKHLCDLS